MNKSTLEPLALKFANYLVKGQYGYANKMIVAEKQTQWNSDWIESEYLEMIDYGEGKPDHLEVMTFDSMADWPAREENDLGWVYLVISGSDYSEAVALIFSKSKGEILIRDIEWGRP